MRVGDKQDAGYKALASAIVAQAIYDYRVALIRLKRYDSYESLTYQARNRRDKAEVTCRGCERFFRSAYWRSLTELDGVRLMEKLRDEVQSNEETERILQRL